MALTAALKAQIAAWYKALQDQIPDFIPRAPQRQMIADVARTLAGEEGRHLAIEAPTGVGKTLSYLIPGIAIAREEQKHWWSVPLTWRYRIRSLARICRCYEKSSPICALPPPLAAGVTCVRETWRRSPVASLRSRICSPFLMMN